MTTGYATRGADAVVSEAQRQEALDELGILDTAPEERFDRITRMAARIFGTRSSAISFIDRDRQWLKSVVGEVDREKRRSDAFCDTVVRERDTLVVPDASADPRFKHNPFVEGDPGLRFYAGHPLEAPGGEPVGSFCVFGPEPRTMTDDDIRLLRDFAGWVQDELWASEELDRAAEVQRGLLPKEPIRPPGYDVAARCLPARVVGGDFYSWQETPGGAAFTIGDVMGKGLSAAIIAATVRGVFLGTGVQGDIVAMATAAADVLQPDLEEAGSFVTMLHARLDAASGDLRYLDSGHGLGLIVRADGSTERLFSVNPPLGIDLGIPLIARHTTIGPGDAFVAVSDGVLDLFDGTLTGLEEVAAIVRRGPDAQAAVDGILALTPRRAADDVTVVIVRRRG
ncbi:PP2C family protein-serine/threonine phosphatase [Planctomonas deserti]|uniref:PP2C family protein-serine/threonine phosphatase n=1 Tax=Planctomonas deserti TaxID=2144185 RepID=UPI000D391A3A|nr:SpoIIE family protein phosphatase [Planctomonas deserti]